MWRDVGLGLALTSKRLPRHPIIARTAPSIAQSPGLSPIPFSSSYYSLLASGFLLPVLPANTSHANMSIDLAHPSPNPSPDEAVRISQLAPKFLKNAPKAAAFPWSLLTPDPPAETWASLETLYLQCLRTGDDKSAKQILDRIVARFGERNERVMAYQGMWEEAMAQGEADVSRVLEIYSKILSNDPSNLVCRLLLSCSHCAHKR